VSAETLAANLASFRDDVVIARDLLDVSNAARHRSGPFPKRRFGPLIILSNPESCGPGRAASSAPKRTWLLNGD
jgi:hypothetical protein